MSPDRTAFSRKANLNAADHNVCLWPTADLAAGQNARSRSVRGPMSAARALTCSRKASGRISRSRFTKGPCGPSARLRRPGIAQRSNIGRRPLNLECVPLCSCIRSRQARPCRTQLPTCSYQSFSFRCSRSRRCRHIWFPHRASGNS